MIRSTLLLVSLAVVAGGSTPPLAETLTPAHFPHHAPIPAALTTGSLYSLHLEPDLLQHCGPGLGDLRLFAPSGAEVPWVILPEQWPAQPPRRQALRVTGFQAGEQVDTLEAELPGGSASIERLAVETSERDFHLEVTVWHDTPGQGWSVVATGEIFDYRSWVDLRRTELSLPTGFTYRRLRLDLREVGPSMVSRLQLSLHAQGIELRQLERVRRRIRIDGLSGLSEAGPAARRVFDEREVSVLSQTRQGEHSVLEVGGRAPLDEFQLQIDTPVFYRSVRAEAEIEPGTDRWVSLSNGVTYAFPLGETAQSRRWLPAVTPWAARFRFTLRDGPAAPLPVRAVTLRWTRRHMLFVAPESGPGYQLGIGDQPASPPEYDLTRFVRPDNWASLAPQPLTHGPITPNPNPRPRPQPTDPASREQWLLTAVAAALGLALGWWLINLLRRPAAPPPPDGG